MHDSGILEGQSSLFLTPVLMLWGGGMVAILTVMYRGEFLCLQIWHDLPNFLLLHVVPRDNLNVIVI